MANVSFKLVKGWKNVPVFIEINDTIKDIKQKIIDTYLTGVEIEQLKILNMEIMTTEMPNNFVAGEKMYSSSIGGFIIVKPLTESSKHLPDKIADPPKVLDMNDINVDRYINEYMMNIDDVIL